MEYPGAYSKVLSELNNAVKLTLINRYGIDLPLGVMYIYG